jgi:roadblock/LC7 domain-containing protein
MPLGRHNINVNSIELTINTPSGGSDWTRYAREAEAWHEADYQRHRQARNERRLEAFRNDPRYIIGDRPRMAVMDPINNLQPTFVGDQTAVRLDATFREINYLERIGDQYVFENPNHTPAVAPLPTTTLHPDDIYSAYRTMTRDISMSMTATITSATTAMQDLQRFTTAATTQMNQWQTDTQYYANVGLPQWNTAIAGNWNYDYTPAKYTTAPRKKAKRLLYSMLTDYQKRMYRKHKYFHVVSETGKKYRLKHGDTMNVYLIEDGKPVKKYCIHPTNVPVEDTLLAQKLMLETDEKAFLKIANKGEVYPHELAA